jgi:hypothetical protein
MKIYFPLLFLFLVLSLTSCEKIFPAPKFKTPTVDLTQLPAETQEGKNTIGCLLNGQVWRNQGGGWFYYDYGASYFKKNFTVYGIKKTEQNNQEISIQLYNSFKGLGIYDLKNDSTNIIVFDDINSSCRYNDDTYTIGKLEITKFDTINYIISGRFNFTLIKPGCDTIRATDGRFDIKYAN